MHTRRILLAFSLAASAASVAFADLVELNPNSNNVSEDRIEQLTNTLAQGSYAESNDIDLPSEPKSEITPDTIHSLRGGDSPVLLKNNRSRYSHLKVDKVTYYPDSSIHRYEFPTWLINCHKKKFDDAIELADPPV